MNELIEWLLGVLDEAERHEKATAALIASAWAGPLAAAAVAGSAPTRELRRIEAIRRIVDDLRIELLDDPTQEMPQQWLRRLASIYADWPGYREEWLPDSPSAG